VGLNSRINCLEYQFETCVRVTRPSLRVPHLRHIMLFASDYYSYGIQPGNHCLPQLYYAPTSEDRGPQKLNYSLYPPWLMTDSVLRKLDFMWTNCPGSCWMAKLNLTKNFWSAQLCTQIKRGDFRLRVSRYDRCD
jgi:hypothetical protein